MHLQRDGHQGRGLQKSRGITLVQVRTIDKLNEEKARMQSGRCRQIKSGD